jgi:hypothetical protein
VRAVSMTLNNSSLNSPNVAAYPSARTHARKSSSTSHTAVLAGVVEEAVTAN